MNFLQQRGDLARLRSILGQQQFDAQCHVFQPPGGVQARPQREADVAGGQPARIAAAGLDQGAQPDAALAGAQAAQAGGDQSAVVVVQRNQIGDGADRDQVEQGQQVRLGLVGERALFAQVPPQRHQHVEDHADAGQRLAREGVAAEVGIDDGVGRRQLLAGQVVVGDQHLPAQRLGRGDTGMAGDAVVDGDQQVRLQYGQFGHQRRRQPVAVHHAVGHRVHHVARAEQAQAAHADRAGGGAIAVEVTDDEDALAAGDRGGKQFHRRRHAAQQFRRMQSRQLRLRLFRRQRATRGVDTAQQRQGLLVPLPALDAGAADDLQRVSHWPASPAVSSRSASAGHDGCGIARHPRNPAAVRAVRHGRWRRAAA